MLPENYTCRCDKHTYKPYEYCEMCYLRTRVQEAVEDSRKAMQHAVGDLYICISEFYEFMEKTRARLKVLEQSIGDLRK